MVSLTCSVKPCLAPVCLPAACAVLNALATGAQKAQADSSSKLSGLCTGEGQGATVSSLLARTRSSLRSLAIRRTLIDARCLGNARPIFPGQNERRARHQAKTFATRSLLGSRRYRVIQLPSDYSLHHARTPADARTAHRRHGSNGQS